MEDQPRSLPQPVWFERTLDYSGRGRIEFSNPQGFVEGEATCTVNELGELTVELTAETWSNNEEEDPNSDLSFDRLLSGVGSQPARVPPMRVKYRATSLTIEVDNGGKVESKQVVDYSWDSLHKKITLEQLDSASFTADVQTETSPQYWIIPLINFDVEPQDYRVDAEAYSEFRAHPLRSMRRIIGFYCSDSPAFIEPLSDYTQSVDALKKGIRKGAVTSLMIGSSAPDHDTMTYVDLTSLLGLATGHPVTASWIECRDSSGSLVSRFHANFGRYTYHSGRAVVSNFRNRGGLAHLLTVSHQTGVASNSEVRGALRNCAHALSEEKGEVILYYVFSALEGLFQYYRIHDEIQPPSRILSSEHYGKINKILEKAAGEIRALNSKDGDVNLFHTINTIAKKTESVPLNKQADFGDKLLYLIQFLGFSDTKYLDTELWKKMVLRHRTLTVHAPHYGDIFDPQNSDDLVVVVSHLRDLLVRMLLRAVGYGGTYLSIAGGHFSRDSELDWVTSAEDLGYT